MIFIKRYIFILIIFLLVKGIYSQKRLSVEFGSGIPFNIPLPLSIHQSDQRDINIIARYDSHPFEIPIFWDWRIGYWQDSTGWELEAIHHKLFLSNKPPEVSEFDITHGLNIVVVNRCIEEKWFILRMGAGVIISHPENTVRGQKLLEQRGILDWGYYVSGPVLNFSISKRIFFTQRIFASFEAKTDLSYSYIPISNGTADVYNIAFILGLTVGCDLLYFQ
jgi:hypothetical protein